MPWGLQTELAKLLVSGVAFLGHKEASAVLRAPQQSALPQASLDL